jgi:FkbM family methyltransferase
VVTDPAELHYPQYFTIREPETLSWIDTFATPCRFWDIGANIGSYSLYAALRPGIEVCAFEPGAANYAALCRNLDANKCSDKVRAYCLAFADRTELGQLNLSSVSPGGVFNVFEETVNCFGETIKVASRQGTLGFSIDEFRRLFNVPTPNYLKIDVDSVEESILAGAAETLADPQLRAVLIEIEEKDTPRTMRLCGMLQAAGLHLSFRSEGSRCSGTNGIFTRVTPSAEALAEFAESVGKR